MHSCNHCSTPYDSAYALAQHLWKSSGSDYEAYDSLDSALEAVFTVHANSKPTDGADLEEQSPNSTVPNSAEQSPDPADAVADGGETGLGLGGKPDVDESPAPDDHDDAASPGADDPQCTECGSREYFDASEVGFDYGCADCSDAEEWVVWNEEEA